MKLAMLAGAITALLLTTAFAQAKEVTIGYQDMVVPQPNGAGSKSA